MEPCKLDTLDEHPSEQGLEVHPLVTLLVARMESHPQEFYVYDPSRITTLAPMTNPSGRGNIAHRIIEPAKKLWNRKEKRLYNLALRKVRMGEAHERLMASLLADK